MLELILGFLKNPKFNVRPILEVLETDFVKLQQEIETHQRLLDGALARMIRSAEKTDALPIAAD